MILTTNACHGILLYPQTDQPVSECTPSKREQMLSVRTIDLNQKLRPGPMSKASLCQRGSSLRMCVSPLLCSRRTVHNLAPILVWQEPGVLRLVSLPESPFILLCQGAESRPPGSFLGVTGRATCPIRINLQRRPYEMALFPRIESVLPNVQPNADPRGKGAQEEIALARARLLGVANQ